MGDTVQIYFEGNDNVTGVIDGIGDAMSGLAGIAKGALAAGLAAATAAFGATSAAMAYSVKQAMDAENQQASFAAVLQSVTSAAQEQAAAFEDASGKIVTVGQVTGDVLGKLQDDYRLTEIAIAEQQSRLDAIAASSGTVNTEYEKQSIKLKNLKKDLVEYGTQLAGVNGYQTDMASALGLTMPKLQITIEQANRLAMEFRDLAGGSDDAIMAIEEIAVRAGTIAADEMPKFIQAVLDLGIVMGGAEIAATTLARAQEDPIAAMGTLQRAGIIFTDSLKDQIKKLADAGDAAGATALLMDRVAEATGGQAAAAASTFSGKLTIMRGHLDEVAEVVGTSLLPILDTLFEEVIKPAEPVIVSIGNAVAKFFDDLEGGRDPLNAVAGLFYSLTQAFGLGQENATGIFNAITGLREPLEALPGQIQGVLTVLQPITEGFANLHSAIVDNWPATKATLDEMGAALATTFANVSPEIISNIGGSLDQLAEFWRNHGETVMGIVSGLWNGIVLTIGGALLLASGLVEVGLMVINGIFDSWSLIFKGKWEEAGNTMALALSLAVLEMLQTFDVFFNSILELMGTNLEEFRAQWQANWDMLQIINLKMIVDIMNTIRSFAGQFQEAGTWLAQHFERGIVLYISQILNTVRGMVRSAIETAGAALGGAVGGAAGSITGAANGGTFSGPTSGYPMVLHGSEAVVPLPDGRSIPVQLQGGAGGGTVTVQLVTSAGDLLATVRGEARANGWDFAQVA